MNIGVAAAIPEAPLTPAPSPALPEIPTADELAAYLRKSRSWVYAAIARGEIPARRVRRSWVLHGPTIKRWLAGERIEVEASEKKRGRR